MRTHRWTTLALCLALAGGSLLLTSCGSPAARAPTAVPEIAFATPEEAVQALAAVVGTGDTKRVEQIFGADGVALLRSGDDVADRNAAEQVKAAILEKVAFDDLAEGAKIARLGKDGFPFPVPLVKGADGWRFDVAAGQDEIHRRRIGRNELHTIATLHEFVDAQREYAAEGRDGNPRAFAQKLFSSDGKHDGLYWPVAQGQPQSPFGPEIAAAAAEGYERSEPGKGTFHGYHYRLLTSQGASAPGGAKSYLDGNGLLTGGFALVAWPAKHGSSGVMTFVINRQGVVFQKDLGADTASLVAAITAYDPDDSWTPTSD